jgi:leukotriene-A4 hydrolase
MADFDVANVARGAPSSVEEKCSQSNYTVARVVHFDCDLAANFEDKTLSGSVDYTVRILAPTREVVLDTKSLVIRDVKVGGAPAQWRLADFVEPFGQALHVSLGDEDVSSGDVSIRVEYSTTPESTALQWLTPAQTAGKEHPYLFSQCQAIHARTMLPCNDTPGVKATYTARVRVPAPLVALMSALQVDDGAAVEDDGATRVFAFRQPVPMPSYLIAIAVGDIVGRDIGPRSRVYSEPSVIEAAAYEFADVEKYVATGEKLFGPYVWGRYDVLVMPPAFPYGERRTHPSAMLVAFAHPFFPSDHLQVAWRTLA